MNFLGEMIVSASEKVVRADLSQMSETAQRSSAKPCFMIGIASIIHGVLQALIQKT